ncbi:MAG: M13 family metallopeptidase [Thermomicrobiales bacterium]
MRERVYKSLLALMVVATILGAGGQAALAQSPVASPVATQHGIAIADMDLTVDPGEDFYQFANGGWLGRTTVPADSPRYNNFSVIQEIVTAQLNAVVAELVADTTTDTGKVKTVYNQALDTDARNAAGITPIAPILDRLATISTIDEGLTYQEQDAMRDGVPGLFGLYADAAYDDATLNVAWLSGPRISLPSEDYYLEDSPEMQRVRDGWIDATTQLLVVAGYDREAAHAAAVQVLAFETVIAAAKTPDAARSDPRSYDNPRTIAELKGILPAFDWDGWLTANDVPPVNSIVVNDITFLNALGGILAESEPSTLRNYFAIQLLWSTAPYLTTELNDIAFSFNGPILEGVNVQSPTDEQALDLVEYLFPDALGQAYVAQEFSPEAKAEIEELVANLIVAFRQRIHDATWMSDATKQKALEKLDLMSVKVGYPDTWETYENVTVGDSLFASVANADAVHKRENLALIGQPVDRELWDTSVFEVNAFYSPQGNEIVFPAAILQAPFFDPEADAASNYGSIGWVIGHEITHGFDRSGSQFDGYGNLSSWWTPEDRAAFEALNDQVVAQYSQVEVMPGLHVNGELTVTENVADLGGLQTAYDALLVEIGQAGQENQPWFLTQQQRFFIAAAATWRQKATAENTRMLLSVDTHSPASVRGVLPARNTSAFYEAFGITEGDPMYLPPDERITIW